MNVETVRLIANALADADHGVGACLAEVPRDVDDPLPATPAIYDETRDDFAALEEFPSELPEGVSWPALVVTLGGGVVRHDPARAMPTRAAPATWEFEATVHVHAYFKSHAAAAIRTAAGYVGRASRGAVQALFHSSRGADRQMNGVQLEVLSGMDALPVFQPLEHVSVAGVLSVRVRGRETAPTITA